MIILLQSVTIQVLPTLLQSASGITKCDSYYKVRRSSAASCCLLLRVVLNQ